MNIKPGFYEVTNTICRSDSQDLTPSTVVMVAKHMVFWLVDGHVWSERVDYFPYMNLKPIKFYRDVSLEELAEQYKVGSRCADSIASYCSLDYINSLIICYGLAKKRKMENDND